MSGEARVGVSFALRPLPGSSNVVTDATDFEALSDAGRAEHYDLWVFSSMYVLYIHAYSTPLGQWLNILGAIADPELDPAHPCLDHHLAESLLLRSFKPNREVLRKHVGKLIVASHRLGGALLRLVDAGLDLELPSFVTPANAFCEIPGRRANIVPTKTRKVTSLRAVNSFVYVGLTPNSPNLPSDGAPLSSTPGLNGGIYRQDSLLLEKSAGHGPVPWLISSPV